MLADGKPITAEISKTCRCLDLIETIAKSIRLESYLDFKILVSVDFKERVVDDNEVIYKIIKNYANLRSEESVFNRCLNSMATFFTQVQQPTFYLRKCLCLSQEQENQDYLLDTTRLKLLAFQALNEIQENQYGFGESEYTIYAPFFLIIKHYDLQREIHSPTSMRQSLVEEIVPSIILRQKRVKAWKSDIYEQLVKQRQQIQQEMEVSAI